MATSALSNKKDAKIERNINADADDARIEVPAQPQKIALHLKKSVAAFIALAILLIGIAAGYGIATLRSKDTPTARSNEPAQQQEVPEVVTKDPQATPQEPQGQSNYGYPQQEPSPAIVTVNNDGTSTLTNDKFSFKMTIPSSWDIEDKSSNVLFMTFLKDGKKLLSIYTLTGKGGMCTPSESDKPHAPGNACSTQEYTYSQQLSSGSYLLRSKITYLHQQGNPDSDRTTYHYCIRSAKDEAPTINNPYMGFAFECGSGEIFVGIFGVDNSTQDFYNQSFVQELEKTLSTVVYTSKGEY